MNYTDTQIQAAIDAAFPVSYYSALIARNDDSRWHEETSCRLAIARAFLAELGKIKPSWTLPPPPAGHKWHRNDWTEDMLPEGYRPLLGGEHSSNATEQLYNGVWIRLSDSVIARPCEEHLRTSRPLPSQASAEPTQKAESAGVDLDAQPPEDPAWVPHNGGPCPLKDEEVEEWEVKWSDEEVRCYTQSPQTFHWEDDFDKRATVKEYRVI